jgi:hypothetical protein
MDDSIIVVKYEDKPKFFDAIKVVETPQRLAMRGIVTVPITLVGAVLLYLVFDVAGPIIALVGFIVYTLLVSHGRGRAVDITTATPLGRLAKTVANFVFVPLVGMAMCNKTTIQGSEADFIRRKMRLWGYSDEFIDAFLKDWSGKVLDSIKYSISTRNPLELSAQISAKKIFRGDIHKKDLCSKAFDLCKAMYNELNNGMRDQKRDDYLKEIKVILGV